MPYKDPEKQKEAQHQSYLRNKERLIEKNKRNRERMKAKVRELMTPCADCGAFDHRFMDWHHTEPHTKSDHVSKLVLACRKWAIIKAEIDKCICLCANCHRIRHAGH